MQGLEKAPVTVEDCCNKIVPLVRFTCFFGGHLVAMLTISQIDSATREKTSGKFINVLDGEELPW